MFRGSQGQWNREKKRKMEMKKMKMRWQQRTKKTQKRVSE